MLVAGAIAFPVLLLPVLAEGVSAVKGVSSEEEGADDCVMQPDIQEQLFRHCDSRKVCAFCQLSFQGSKNFLGRCLEVLIAKAAPELNIEIHYPAFRAFNSLAGVCKADR